MEKAGDILRKMGKGTGAPKTEKTVKEIIAEGNALLLQKRAESMKETPAKTPETPELSPQMQHLADAAELIRHSWPGKDDLAYLAKHLVQVTLPHSDPGNVEIWTRTNGHLTLSIVRVQRDHRNGRLIGYPYGTIPRLLLYWLTSEAVRTKSRVVKLGNTLSQFMKEVGLNPETGGGKRGDAVRLKEQMSRLFASSISFQYADEEKGTSWLNMPVTRRAQLWWNPKDPAQGNLFESWIELGEDFFNAITSSPVPLDTRALRALNHSALALDLYGWATYKTYVQGRKREAQFISYADLQSQLGAQYGNVKDFKRKLLAALKQVQAVYPLLKYTQARGGLVIHPSRPSVPITALKNLI
jgi:hypothetical protein